MSALEGFVHSNNSVLCSSFYFLRAGQNCRSSTNTSKYKQTAFFLNLFFVSHWLCAFLQKNLAVILLQWKKIKKRNKHGVAIYILEGNTSLVQLPMTYTTLFLRGASFYHLWWNFAPCRGYEGILFCCGLIDYYYIIIIVDSVDAFTLQNIHSFYLCDLLVIYSKGCTLKFVWFCPQIRVHILDHCIKWKVIRQS